MTDQEFLLQGIIEHPQDDTRRLVYADWLEENGDPARAELIRLQMVMANLSAHDPRMYDVWRRQADMVEAHGERWRGELPQDCVFPHPAHFQRGFPSGLWIQFEDFLEFAPKLFPSAPVDSLFLGFRIDGNPVNAERLRHVASIFASPYLKNLNRLGLHALDHGDAVLSELPASHPFEKLKILSVDFGRVSAVGLEALARSGLLPQLHELDLCGNHFGDAGAASLLADGRLKSIRRLNLGFNDLSDESARGIADCRSLKNLHYLYLATNPIGEEGICALARSPHLAQLRSLSLHGTYLTPRGVEALAHSPHLRNVEWLDLGRGSDYPSLLRDEGVRALAASTTLDQLVDLTLSGHDVGDEGAIALASWPGFRRLSRLHLNLNHIGDEGIAAIAASPNLGSLETLEVGNNDFGDKGVASLATSSFLHRLRVIEIGNNPIGGSPIGVESIRSLLASGPLPRLRELRICESSIGDAGAIALANSAHLQNLRVLDLCRSEISCVGARALAASPSLASLKSLSLMFNRIGKEAHRVLRERFGRVFTDREPTADDGSDGAA